MYRAWEDPPRGSSRGDLSVGNPSPRDPPKHVKRTVNPAKPPYTLPSTFCHFLGILLHFSCKSTSENRIRCRVLRKPLGDHLEGYLEGSF